MAHFKRKNYKSGVMGKCSLCGSQRRIFGENPKYKLLWKALKQENKKLRKNLA
jgi:hypothetical protein